MREFFANGVVKLRFAWAVEAVPALIHISLFLFFTGLLIYLFNTNHTVFISVACWVGVFGAIYILIAFIPIIRLDSPYRAPLSSPVCRASAGILYLLFGILGFFAFASDVTRTQLYNKSNYYRKWVTRGVKEITEGVVGESSSEIDGRVLKWTFDTLAEDHEREKFFETIPGFSNSGEVKNPQNILAAELGKVKLSSAVMGFLSRTSSSNSVSETDKRRRFVICVKVADAARLSRAAWQILQTAFCGKWNRILQSVEAADSLKSKDGNKGHPDTDLCAQSLVAGIIAHVEKRDDRWIALAAEHLGKSEAVLRGYVAHGDSVLLANLIHITRRIFKPPFGSTPPPEYREMAKAASHNVLPSLSGFDIQHTLPELQHDFCALWNAIVVEAQGGEAFNSHIYILKYIRHLYIALHNGTEAAPEAFSASTDDHQNILGQPASYPVCTIEGHL